MNPMPVLSSPSEYLAVNSNVFNFRRVDAAGFLDIPARSGRRNASVATLKSEGFIKAAASLLDPLAERILSCTSISEFHEVLSDTYPTYVETVMGISHAIQANESREDLDTFYNVGLDSIEAVLRSKARDRFGEEIYEQALFTIWTLRQIRKVCKRIDRLPVADENSEADRELYKNFLAHGLMARLIMFCLLEAIHNSKVRIHPSIFPGLLDGLKHEVNAFAYAREAEKLRNPAPDAEHSTETQEWDEEDRQLLDEAMYDFVTAEIQ